MLPQNVWFAKAKLFSLPFSLFPTAAAEMPDVSVVGGDFVSQDPKKRF